MLHRLGLQRNKVLNVLYQKHHQLCTVSIRACIWKTEGEREWEEQGQETNRNNAVLGGALEQRALKHNPIFLKRCVF